MLRPTLYILMYSLLFAFPPQGAARDAKEPAAEGGWLDFRSQTLAEPLELLGPWDFFWGFRWRAGEKAWPSVEERVEIARAWTDFIDPVTGHARENKGYATYRLQITGLKPRPGGYIIRLRAEQARLWLYQDGGLRVGATPSGRGELSLRFAPTDALESWVLVVERRQSGVGPSPAWSVPQLALHP